MRFSKLFGRTLREAPAEAEVASHRLLLRASMVRQVAAGVYSYLPLGWRVLRRIEQIVREEMNAVDGQELLMPVLQPAELWQESGRWYTIGPELFRLRDRTERDFVLAMTHEEVVTELARREILSYRQLPCMVYQIQIKERDEARPRGGLIRVREFSMKDGYSFHADHVDLDAYYPRIVEAYKRIFSRCGIDVVDVLADPGMIGGSDSHEFMLLSGSGEDILVRCPSCGYAANVETACAASSLPNGKEPAELPLLEVATPGARSIAEVSDYLSVPPSGTMKSVFYTYDDRLAVAVVRGDLEINEVKLRNALHVSELRLASDDELRARGIISGSASPIGLRDATIVVDESVPQASNLVAGANREGYHVRNVNFPRDFSADVVADIASVQPGDACLVCGGQLEFAGGIEVGHTFKLGTKYSTAMDATFLDKDGQKKPFVMGCYGIGIGRLMAAVVEQNHDSRGIVWPAAVAPFAVHLVALGVENEAVRQTAEALYGDLQADGVAVLYDDRDETAGVKFNDADLIGIPVRLTVSQRTLRSESVEIKRRNEEGPSLVRRDEIAVVLASMINKA